MQLEQEKVMHEKSAELKDVQLQLESEVKHAKERELTALQLRIFEIKEKVIELLKSNELNIDDQAIEKLVNNVNGCFENEDYWKEFQFRFTNMHPTFSAEVTRFCHKLTKKDIDFLTLIKLNLNNKEIATLISISYESVISKRYLLRKKMGFSSDNELVSFLETL
ncbi:MAG: hypothetical protein EAZ58_14495 [Flavobacterium sp.]|nr:MAG: hypothetical protein EAZ58_14495 [Flavobacterium sp.]